MGYVRGIKLDLEELIKEAEGGDAEAQYRMGRSYLVGRFTERDYSEALKWFKKSAEQGNKKAMVWLASSYYKGTYGNEVNYDEAFKWYTNADCRSGMGKCYFYGHGAEQSYEMAVKCFTEADDKNMLGECYLNGLGVERNVEKTIELWEALAEENSSHYMYEKLWRLLIDGTKMEPDYKRGFHWLEYSAFADGGDPEGGNYEARYELSRCYYEGKGVKKDVKRALVLFRSAIALFYKYDGASSISEEPECIINARKILVKHGYKTEINKIKKAAEAGDVKAMEILKEFNIEFVSKNISTDAASEGVSKKASTVTRKCEPPIDVAVGQGVFHKTFGKGVVCEADNGHIRVEFPVGKKEFLNPDAFNKGFLKFV
jgi:TPR repeat protein